MTVGQGHQLPADDEVFAHYLRELTALVDTGAGWCGVFWQRDPDGMRACLDGGELPPRDVLEALLQDLAAGHGIAAAEQEAVRARALHAAAAAAHDRRPGGGEMLAERLEAMRREQGYAAERERELAERLRVSGGGADGQGLDIELAWARDDHERATARCAELSARLTALGTLPPPSRGRPPAPESWFREAVPEPSDARETTWPGQSRETRTAEASFPHPAPSRSDNVRLRRVRGQAPGPPDALRARPQAPDGLDSAGLDIPVRQLSARPAIEDRGPGRSPDAAEPRNVTVGKGRGGEEETPRARPRRTPAPKRRPRGARYAGLDEDDGSDVAAGPAMPTPPVQAAAPRGARYAGVQEEAPPVAADPADAAQDRRAVTGAVAVLVQLRAQGRTGEAHVLLCEAAGWPAARLPVLAEALHHAGLGADWATLLWEVASLPPDRVAAVAAALAAAGLDDDGRQLLRQGVARPAPEIAAALLALDESGKQREVRALVDAFVRVRTPENVAEVARADPRRLSPLLLDAARQVSQSRYRDVVHALRVAGAAQ